MAEKKRQHYVPQFYLRLFATTESDRHVRLYNIDRGDYVPCAPIKEQAQENYFYQSRDIEDALGVFEGRVASVIQQIIRDTAVPKTKSDEFTDLLLFLLLQHSRTRYAADEYHETWKKYKEVVLGGKPESLLPPELQDEVGNVPKFLMQVTISNVHVARDLHAKLIINRTPDPFITSDNPVVLYNHLLKLKRVPGGRTGIGCKGLQIFLPLNDRLLLVLFDGDMYFVGGKRVANQRVEVTRPKDVRHLNRLQVVNANRNLYFNNSAQELYIRELMKISQQYRRTDKVIVEEYPASGLAVLPQGSLIVNHRAEIDAPLDLSCIRIRRAGLRYDPRGKPVHMRDNAILQALEEAIVQDLGERLVGKQFAGIYAKKSHP